MQLLLNFDELLAIQIRQRPDDLIPVCEEAIKKVFQNHFYESICGFGPVPTFQLQI